MVVCPLAVYSAWVNDLQKLTIDYDVKVLTGTMTQKVKLMKRQSEYDLEIVIVNYESFWRKQLFTEIRKFNPDMIIADESHKLKSPTSSQSRYMHFLGDRAQYKLLLTGTPVCNNPLDVWSQYRFLDKRIFGENYFKFRDYYTVPKEITLQDGRKVKLWNKFQHLDDLQKRLYKIAHRVTKDECLDLPAKTNVYRSVELEPQTLRVYHEIKDNLKAEIDDGVISASNSLVKALVLTRITGGFADVEYYDNDKQLTQVSKAKLDGLSDVLDETDPDKKVVIFARFTAEIKAIKELLSKRYKPNQIETFTGATPAKDRIGIIDRFQNDPDVKIFLANIQCAGLGITLTASDLMIFYSLSYSMTDHEQARARIHRLGQKNCCVYCYLYCQKTIDETIIKAIKKKADIAESVLSYLKS
jgi:SNF2 family DNA or RNA helicase